MVLRPGKRGLECRRQAMEIEPLVTRSKTRHAILKLENVRRALSS